ncbi:hypothetical protein MKW98_006581 [Papaver atlanticum]|uniref:Uncharacterized protein n=1 Tax=Papaver atlanticum TaxID=357466 RepID=A0AAD4XTU5_9MAGN|nr:hypothetical protein MKW98_006581 [Papaver atlanticum]
MAEDNGGNPPTDGDVFIKTHVNKKTGKALDPISQGFIVQMREQSGLDENGFDEDGNQQPICDEVFGNVVPTTRRKRVRAERYPTCSSYDRNEDFERRMKEREEDFDRRIRERDAEWEARLKARDEEAKMRENKMSEYVRLCCGPEYFLSLGQFSGPSDLGRHYLHRGSSLTDLWSNLIDLGNSLIDMRNILLDLRISLIDMRNNSLDLRSSLTDLRSNCTDLTMIEREA